MMDRMVIVPKKVRQAVGPMGSGTSCWHGNGAKNNSPRSTRGSSIIRGRNHRGLRPFVGYWSEY
jgi:hypothetical protein